MFKRTLCGAVAAIMLFAGMPTAAFAAELPEAADYDAALQKRMNQIVLPKKQAEPTSLAANERQVLDINTDWLFVKGDVEQAKNQNFDESGAEKATLPHARQDDDLYTPDLSQIETIE